MQKFLDSTVLIVRSIMKIVARTLNKLSFGKISPSSITITGLLAHLPIAYLIATGSFIWGGCLLIFFGLFDTLDGELARLQNKASAKGMVLDAVTDRMKEVVIYSAVTFYFVDNNLDIYAVWATLLCGGALLVSYVKAKGETAVKDTKLSANQINRLFSSGIMRYEVRMFILFLGLVLNHLPQAVVFLAITTWLTAFGRLIKILGKLNV